MLRSLKISGFKNFKGKSIELTNLKRINLLVGINGSGKSSVLELLALSSRFYFLNSGGVPMEGSNIYELNSLFGPQTDIIMTFDNATCSYKIIPQNRNNWTFQKDGTGEGPLEVTVVWRSKPFAEGGNPPETRPFGNIREVKIGEADTEDLGNAQELLKEVNDGQRLFTKKTIRLEDIFSEGDNEIWPDRLAGGTQYLAMLFRAIKLMPQGDRPTSIILVDDLGDSIFPALRKAIIPKLNKELEKHPEDLRAQMFATTHNVEIVKAALENLDYCSVYMFDYDGSLIEFDGLAIKKVDSSFGLRSIQEIPVIAKMLGLTDLDLGFPEMVVLTEEETKRSFLNSLEGNPNFEGLLKKYEIQVPFQQGDGNVSKAINSLLNLSKYFSFSEIWSDRYAIFTDHNAEYYDQSGNVKEDDSQHIKALKKAQDNLTLGRNFLLTKKNGNLVSSMEETYPDNMWKDFKNERSIPEASIQDWIASKRGNEKGKAKNELAEFIGSKIDLETFNSTYPELSQLLVK